MPLRVPLSLGDVACVSAAVISDGSVSYVDGVKFLIIQN